MGSRGGIAAAVVSSDNHDAKAFCTSTAIGEGARRALCTIETGVHESYINTPFDERGRGKAAEKIRRREGGVVTEPLPSRLRSLP